MKKLLLSTMVLGSTIALSACGSVPACNESLDNCDRSGPYTEERTIGTTGGNVNLPKVAAPTLGSTTTTSGAVSGATVSGDTIVRSAEPVFENSQVK